MPEVGTHPLCWDTLVLLAQHVNTCYQIGRREAKAMWEYGNTCKCCGRNNYDLIPLLVKSVTPF